MQHTGLIVYLQNNILPEEFAKIYVRMEIIVTNATILSELLIVILYMIRTYILIVNRSRERQFIEMSFIRERLFDTSNNPMIVLKDNDIVSINSSAQKLFGESLRTY
jgi:hypothetical protein